MAGGKQAPTVDPEVSQNKQWAEKAFSATGDLPFSFVYGGKPSSEFIRSWKHQVEDATIDPTTVQRTLTLTDPDTGLEVKAVARIYTDTAGVDWILHFTNHGSKDTPIIEQVHAVDQTVKPALDVVPVLHRLKGNLTGAEYSADDFLPFDVPFPIEKRSVFGPELALSSFTDSPFFNLQYSDGGVITAVGWTGHWGASVERTKDGFLRVETGMRDMKLRLHPGETIRSPRILQVHWTGNDELRSYNLFRRTMFAHVLPRIDGKLVMPPIAHMTNCFYSQNSGTEKEILEYIDSIKGLGFECLWLDAFYSKDGWPDGIGNYGYPMDMLVDTRRYPHSLAAVSDAAHKQGMSFLLWTAPERACKGTYIYEKHPEWMLGAPDQQTKLYDMGNPAAREYMTKYLIDLIREYKIDCIRFDCGALIGEMRMKDALEPDRAGMTEIRYHEGLYRMWDDILKAYPNVYIDNCCGGGNRIDLETCSRSLPLWRTDGVGYPLAVWTPHDYDQAALQNQVISAGLSRYVPLSTSGQMGVTPFEFRSAFNGGIPFAEDTRRADYPKDQLKQAIAEGKRIRKYFLGDFYPLNEVTASPEDWSVLQYHRPTDQDGMLLAFRRQKSPYPSFTCNLREIDPEASYKVTISPTYKPANPVTMKGSDLQKLTITTSEMPGSVLVEYSRQRER